MPDEKTYCSTLFASVFCTGIVWLGFFICHKSVFALNIGFLLGTLVTAGTLRLFFMAWRAAPNGGMVALWYALRIVLTVASIGAALVFSGTAALGVLLPQLFPIPLLALFLIFRKEG
ncbi:MAG: hypothetical protein RR867_06030 [Ruthenibacterium sp.]